MCGFSRTEAPSCTRLAVARQARQRPLLDAGRFGPAAWSITDGGGTPDLTSGEPDRYATRLDSIMLEAG